MSFTRSLTAPQQDFVDIIGRSTLPLMAAPMFLVSMLPAKPPVPACMGPTDWLPIRFWSA